MLSRAGYVQAETATLRSENARLKADLAASREENSELKKQLQSAQTDEVRVGNGEKDIVLDELATDSQNEKKVQTASQELAVDSSALPFQITRLPLEFLESVACSWTISLSML